MAVVDALSRRVGSATSWLTTLLVLVVCFDVFTRYFLARSLVAVQELEWHLFAVLFLVGAAWTLERDRHVRVDALYGRFSGRTRAWIDLGGVVLFLVPFCVVVMLSSRAFVAAAFRLAETSPDPGGLPARFLLKAMIPVGFALVLLQGLALGARAILTLRGEPVIRDASPESAP